MRSLFLFVAAASCLAFTGCRSAFIQATVSNRTQETLSLVEVDYPSASFGTQTLAPGQDFHYRFKVLGSGQASIAWTDSSRHEHKAPGLSLQETSAGNMTITFQPGAAPAWNLQPPSR
jgi:hypothetical protein